MTKTTLLIDADVVAYRAASAMEEAYEYEPGFWTWHVSFDAVLNRTLKIVRDMENTLMADRSVLCLTHPHDNFRLRVLPTYKTHRKTVRKPLVLFYLKEYLVDKHGAKMVPGLEGDDLMGILATTPSKDHRIIVSVDKDMKTIPCNYVRTEAVVDTEGAELQGAMEEVTISEDEADYNHLSQTLTGDTTDGYAGCPGIGPKKVDDVITLGATITDNWSAVVKAFEKKGLTEEDALQQARVARILRASDFDMKNREVKLWNPPAISAEQRTSSGAEAPTKP